MATKKKAVKKTVKAVKVVKKVAKKVVKKAAKKTAKKAVRKDKRGFELIGKPNKLSKDTEYLKLRDALIEYATKNDGNIVIGYGEKESHSAQTTVLASGRFVQHFIFEMINACQQVDSR